MTAENIVKQKQIDSATKALKQYLLKKNEEQRSLVSELDGEDIHLQLTFKKTPRMKNVKIKIPLSYSLIGETSDVCLFVKDIDKNERDYSPTVRFYKDLLSKHGVHSISQILPMKALKLEYGPYEAKRNLSNMYDLYLADSRILRLLPGFLGKSFYGRKRYPLQVNMSAKDLKKEFDRVLHTTQCLITGRGSVCQVLVAHSGMTEKQIAENIQSAVATLGEKIPGGANNIRGLHIRTADSPAIPLYASFTSANDVELPAPPQPEELDEPEEISTVFGAKVRVTASGLIQVIPDKATNSDDGDDDDGDDGEDKDAELAKTKRAGSKRKRKTRKDTVVSSPTSKQSKEKLSSEKDSNKKKTKPLTKTSKIIKGKSAKKKH